MNFSMAEMKKFLMLWCKKKEMSMTMAGMTLVIRLGLSKLKVKNKI